MSVLTVHVFTNRISVGEASAIRSLKEKICATKSTLIDEFQKHDPANMGL